MNWLHKIRNLNKLHLVILVNVFAFILVFGITQATLKSLKDITHNSQSFEDSFADLTRIEELAESLSSMEDDLFDGKDLEKDLEITHKTYNKLRRYVDDLHHDIEQSTSVESLLLVTDLEKLAVEAQKILEIKLDLMTHHLLYSHEKWRKLFAELHIHTSELHRISGKMRKNWMTTLKTFRNQEYDAIESHSDKALAFLSLCGVLIAALSIAGQFSLWKNHTNEKLVEFYQYALDRSAIIAITDAQGKIIHVNDAFCEISGYSRAELIGQDHRLLNSGVMGPLFFKEMWGKIRTGEVWRGDICNRTKSGSLYWVASTVVPMRGKDGRPIRYVSVRKDITARKLQEAELRTAKKKAEDSAAIKAKFLAVMSHEIRTPLNGILGMLSLLQDHYVDSQAGHYLQLMSKNGQMLSVLLNDILDFSKIEAGKLQLENTPYQLSHLILETVSVLYPDAHEKSLRLETQLDPLLPKFILGDPTRFKQVLMNLLSNAIKFTSQGYVKVQCRAKPLAKESTFRIELCISDSGIGMTPEDQLKLFSAFSQVDGSTTRRFGGTGLGLAICKGICESMNGKIWVESEMGKGSSFYVSFTAEESRGAVDVIPGNLQKIDTQLAKKYPLEILVADDNLTNRLVAGRFLEKLGYMPDLVNDGQQAADAYAQKKYDFILMDIHMPQMDGYAASAAIREMSKQPQSPWIVAFTAGDRTDESGNREKSFLNFHMNAVLYKPFSLPSLQDAILQAMDQPMSSLTHHTFSLTEAVYAVDKERLLKRFENDEDILIQVIRAYLRTAPSMYQRLESAIKTNDDEQTAYCAHQIKSSLSNFDIPALQTSLHQLEQLVQEKRFEQLLVVWQGILPYLTRLLIDLEEMIPLSEVA